MMVCIEFIEEYKGYNINKDNTVKQDRFYAVLGNGKIVYGSSIEILKRKMEAYNGKKN